MNGKTIGTVVSIALLWCLQLPSLAGQSQYVAQVVDGANAPEDTHFYRTTFQIVNLSAEEESKVTVSLFRNDGSQLSRLAPPSPPGGGVNRLVLSIPPLGQSSVRTVVGPFTEVGWARFETTGAAVGVVATLQFRELGGENRLETAASVPVEPTAKRFSSFALVDGELRRTGFAVLNTSTTDEAEVRFELFDTEGEFFDERTITLGPGEKIAQFLNENELFTELEQFGGSVEITGSEELACMVIRVDGLHWSAFRLFPGRIPESDPQASSRCTWSC